MGVREREYVFQFEVQTEGMRTEKIFEGLKVELEKVTVYPEKIKLFKEVLKVNVDVDKLPYKDNTFDEIYCKNLLREIPSAIVRNT